MIGKSLAERKAGEALSMLAEKGQLTAGRPKKSCHDDRISIVDLGLAEGNKGWLDSSRWQREAEL